MAYGKDASALPVANSFRQGAGYIQASRPKFGGSNTGERWANSFRPSLDTPDEIRLIKGDYEMLLANETGGIEKLQLYYYMHTEHYHATLKKSAICSAGPAHAFKNLRGPCHGCDMFWEGREQGRNSGPMSKRDLYDVNVLHFAPYGKIEQVDKITGKVRTDSAGKPYYSWQRILHHERQKFQGKEMREMHMMHWSLGYGHWQVLLDYDKFVGQSCKSCRGMETIVPEAYACPRCGVVVIDINTTQLSPTQIEETTRKICKCPKCGAEVFLQEHVSCKECKQGARATLFDVHLKLKRIPGANSTQNTLAILGWEWARPIPQHLASIVVPMDFPKIFAPDSLETQASIWQIKKKEEEAEPQKQMYRPYVPQVSSFQEPAPQQYSPTPQQYSPNPQYPPSPFSPAPSPFNPAPFPTASTRQEPPTEGYGYR